MSKNLQALFLFLIWVGFGYSQTDSIRYLNEIHLADVKLQNNSTGQFVQDISGESIERAEPLLTGLLKFNSPFFFRENGYGMVSSASVRGTGAAQTAVVWNGININSQFTGQTDFNTVNTMVFDEVSLRPGGGSVVYGSGAIGGTIHLSNDFQFKGKTENSLDIGYGSFDTYQVSYRGDFSNEQTNLKVGFSGISSENDYPYKNSRFKNENGDFYNISLNTTIAHWLAEKHLLKFYSNYYQGSRAFSGTVTTPSNSEYFDRNSRNLIEWKYLENPWTSSLKLAYLIEKFQYFENRDNDNFTFGNANTAIFKYDLGYELNSANEFHLIADQTIIKGEGSGINTAHRNTTGLAFLYNGRSEKLKYEASLRQEFTSNFESPLLFNLGVSYGFIETYSLHLNLSRNYRIPTFNDLFWTSGGNENLNPEKSIQAEIGNAFKFQKGSFRLNAFYMDISNLIRWIPSENGIWQPVNTAEVRNYGLELFADWQEQVFKNPLQFQAGYAYTRSEDQRSGNQLIYTPFHKATFTADYELEKFQFFYQSLYNGEIFTSSDNNYSLQGYYLADIGLKYQISAKPEMHLQFQIKNLFDKKYESMPSRIMPGRHFKTLLTLNF